MRTMKKILFLFLFLSTSVFVKAQHPAAGTVSIIPRVGVSLSSLPGDKVYVSGTVGDELPFSSRYKAGFTGGLDIDWLFMPNLSATLGVIYTQQGCKYKNDAKTTATVYGDAVNKGVGYSDWSTTLHYVNVPLMLNAYLAPGFAVKAGVQLGFAVSGKMKYTSQNFTQTKEGIEYEKPEKTTYNLNSTLSKVTVAIPVGVSYEFSNVIIDARYHFGLTGFQNIPEVDSSKNRVLTFTAGYRFTL